MANISYLKGVRTRFRGILQKEVQLSDSILQSEVSSSEEQEFILRTSKCIDRIKLYLNKIEIQSGKIAEAIGSDKPEEIESIIEENCQLHSEATDRYLELEHFKDNLLKFIRKSNTTDKASDSTLQLVKLQNEMKNIFESQLKQHQEIIEIQTNKEKENSSAVKLPKLDIIPFNGDKMKWSEFWDSFENAVHNNKKLSNVEKFSYLKSKLQGDAKYSVAGLNLSNENYGIAIKTLKDRFGNVQNVIDRHYNMMINLRPPVSKTVSLRIFLDKVMKHLRSLEVLKQDINQSVFVSMVKSKLPEDVLLQLEIQKDSDESWTIVSLCEKLRKYVDAREKSEKREGPREQNKVNNSGFTKVNSEYRPFQRPQHLKNDMVGCRQVHSVSSEALVVNSARGKNNTFYDKCRYCESTHWSDECSKYKTIEERKKQLKGSCYKCLRHGHLSADCTRNKACVHCGEINSHHRSLCPRKFRFNVSSVHLSEEISEYPSNIDDSSVNVGENVLISSGEMVLMQTAKTEIRNPQLQRGQVSRVLFDSGSQRTYISQSLATQLDLKGEKEEEIKLVTFGSENPKLIKTLSTKINIRLNNGEYISIEANIVPIISGSIQRRKMNLSSIDHLRHFVKDIELADDIPLENECSTIDILIGNDYYMDFILSQRIEIQPGLYILASKLGWIVTGRTYDSDNHRIEPSLFVMTYGKDVNESNLFTDMDSSLPLQPELSDLWNIESIGIGEEPDTSEIEKVMSSFKKTIKFKDGRFHVKWPWKEDEPDLPTNRNLAMGRLRSLIVRMQNQPDVWKEYNRVIQEQLEKGVIEKVKDQVSAELVHYIPHHAVINPLKPTTKLRIVYDASAKERKDSRSLNECLYRGPVLLKNLSGILMRFRLQHIALVADIEKAFLQIGLQEDDRDVTRFFWIKECEQPSVTAHNVEIYRFCRVPFGIISSPFLLGATIEYHLDSYGTELANSIKENIYVDNLVTGVNSPEEAVRFYKKSKSMFKDASMNLREWASNSTTVNEFIQDNDRSDLRETKVLGHIWNIQNDSLSLKPTNISKFSEHPTKRSTLKKIAEVFDPLGLFAPVLIKGKFILQDLWKKTFRLGPRN